MTMQRSFSARFWRQAAVAILASALGAPGWAQAASDTQAPPAQTIPSQTADEPPAAAQPVPPPAKEGFWGRLNPFARKKWVKKQIAPINDQLNELDQVNANNARDIRDVDARAQAGIGKAQAAADQANQAANAASQEAMNANGTALTASNHLTAIDNTVDGLDHYRQVSEVEIRFRPGSTFMGREDKAKLDQLAAGLTGHEGYLLEMDAQAPGSGSVGIRSSQQLAEAVKRYLLIEHQIPIYRMRAVALGNMQVAANDAAGSDSDATADGDRPAVVRTRSVRVRLMENSLAAQ